MSDILQDGVNKQNFAYPDSSIMNPPSTNENPKKPKPILRTEQKLPVIHEHKRDKTLDSMELIAKKELALHFQSLNIPMTSSVLEDVFGLFELFMDNILTDLQKLTQLQRRKKASPKDIQLLFRNCHISTSDLEEELLRSKKKLSAHIIAKKQALETLSESLSKVDIEPVELDNQDPSFVFYVQDDDIYKLVPTTYSKKNHKGIPKFLPEFPPDHTYRKSPIYLNKIPDQRYIRSKIVEESKLGEEALDHLTSYNKRETSDEVDGEEDREVVKEEQKEKPLEYDIWNFSDKKLNVPAYAKARLEFLKRKKGKEIKKKDSYDGDYDKIVVQLSPFVPVHKKGRTEDNKVSESDYIEKLFKSALTNIKTLKRKKTAREIEKEKLQKEAEELKKKEIAGESFNEIEDNAFANFENFENFDAKKFENFEKFGNEHISDAHEINFGVDDSKVEDGEYQLDINITEDTLMTEVPNTNIQSIDTNQDSLNSSNSHENAIDIPQPVAPNTSETETNVQVENNDRGHDDDQRMSDFDDITLE
ncbi:hypothetical protein WICMUC_003212 [Wickerhamomyces mucosus]|uniref:Transcription initiation factor TFIID subunit 8 n=1 Tax=Wickerhamomyces mucosus TaxID=1378264 RepID=A0A9P8PN55_9ASCO|nr:hypothetical protein WICMUC_003212 [Wickerhamomyces mucosus]